MWKPLLVLSVVILIAFTAANTAGLMPQQGQSAPAAAPGAPVVHTAPATVNPVKPTPESQARAKTWYGYDCALCHGDNGRGGTDFAREQKIVVPDLADPAALASMSDADMFVIIRYGKGKMPAETEARASDSDVWNLILYERGLVKGQVAVNPHLKSEMWGTRTRVVSSRRRSAQKMVRFA